MNINTDGEYEAEYSLGNILYLKTTCGQFYIKPIQHFLLTNMELFQIIG